MHSYQTHGKGIHKKLAFSGSQDFDVSVYGESLG